MRPDQEATPTPARTPWSPSLLLVVGSLLVGGWVSVDVVSGGWWLRADLAVADWVDNVDLRSRDIPNALLWMLSQTGGRGTVLAVVALTVGWVMWEHRVWQPLLRVLVAGVLLTVVVYAFKLGLGRTAPGYGASVFYVEGLSFPSGHSANAVLWWGLVVWNLRSYAMPAWANRAGTAVAVAAPVLTTVAMILLNYHWVSDIVTGLALGVVLLWLVQRLFATRLGELGATPRRRRERVAA